MKNLTEINNNTNHSHNYKYNKNQTSQNKPKNINSFSFRTEENTIDVRHKYKFNLSFISEQVIRDAKKANEPEPVLPKPQKRARSKKLPLILRNCDKAKPKVIEPLESVQTVKDSLREKLLAKYNSLINAGNEKEEEEEEEDEGAKEPEETSFQKLIKLKQLKEMNMQQQISNVLTKYTKADVIQGIKSIKEKDKRLTSESNVIKYLDGGNGRNNHYKTKYNSNTQDSFNNYHNHQTIPFQTTTDPNLPINNTIENIEIIKEDQNEDVLSERDKADLFQIRNGTYIDYFQYITTVETKPDLLLEPEPQEAYQSHQDPFADIYIPSPHYFLSRNLYGQSIDDTDSNLIKIQKLQENSTYDRYMLKEDKINKDRINKEYIEFDPKKYPKAKDFKYSYGDDMYFYRANLNALRGYDAKKLYIDEFRGQDLKKLMKKKYRINLNEFRHINPFDRSKSLKPKIEYEFILLMTKEFLYFLNTYRKLHAIYQSKKYSYKYLFEQTGENTNIYNILGRVPFKGIDTTCYREYDIYDKVYTLMQSYTQLLGYKLRTNMVKETVYTLNGTLEFSFTVLIDYLSRSNFQYHMQKLVDEYYDYIEKILEPNEQNLSVKDIMREKMNALKPLLIEMILEYLRILEYMYRCYFEASVYFKDNYQKYKSRDQTIQEFNKNDKNRKLLVHNPYEYYEKLYNSYHNEKDYFKDIRKKYGNLSVEIDYLDGEENTHEHKTKIIDEFLNEEKQSNMEEYLGPIKYERPDSQEYEATKDNIDNLHIHQLRLQCPSEEELSTQWEVLNDPYEFKSKYSEYYYRVEKWAYLYEDEYVTLEPSKTQAEGLLADYLEDEKIMENLVLEKMNDLVSQFCVLTPYMPAYLDIIKWFKFTKGDKTTTTHSNFAFMKLIHEFKEYDEKLRD